MNSFNEVWDKVCAFLVDNEYIGATGYDLWVKPMVPIKLKEGVAYLMVDAPFQKGIITDTYAEPLKIGFEKVLGFPVEIQIQVKDEVGDDSNPYKTQGAVEYKKSLVNSNYEFTFENFIVGPSNKLAHAAALAVATNPGNVYNPLFIYGNSGLGKTHLLNAIYTEILENSPNTSIIFKKGESFTNEYISSVMNQTVQSFQEKYRSVDVLIIDDIQFISGKQETQVAFFHIIETLFENHKQVIFSSDRPPKEITTLTDRMRSRFEMGLIVDIAVPDFETRVAIMKRKAELLNFYIPDDVIEYISDKLKSNIRQLEGVIKKLKAYQTIEGRKPNISLAHTAIQDVVSNSKASLTPEQIIAEVARTFGVTAEDIVSQKRDAEISVARKVSVYVIRKLIPDITLKSIGKVINRNHSSLIYHIEDVEKTMKTDSYFKSTVEDIIASLKNEESF